VKPNILSQSVIVVGSANTAFDVMEDCQKAGLEVTMVQRSATLVFPMTYLENPAGFGAWNYAPPEAVDPVMLGMPLAVGGQLVGRLNASLAAQEPYVYQSPQYFRLS
jgi:hypothetical protein